VASQLQDRDSWMVDPAAAQIPLGVFSSQKNLTLAIVALSFVFVNQCPIID
jgi:hypothetical protein